MNENNDMNFGVTPQPVPTPTPEPQSMPNQLNSFDIPQSEVNNAQAINPYTAEPEVELPTTPEPTETLQNYGDNQQTTFVPLNEEIQTDNTQFDKKTIAFMAVIFVIIIAFIIALPYITDFIANFRS